MSCWLTIQDYALRSIGIGERLLPRDDFTLCQQFTLIGSGLIWNVYFGAFAMIFGFFIANAVALGKNSGSAILRVPSEWFIFIFRGSPLFIQFFFAYFLFLSLKQAGILPWLTAAQAGARVRLLGVGGSELSKDAQPDLFGPAESRGPSQVDQAVDGIRDRFGSDSLSRARSIDPDQIR